MATSFQQRNLRFTFTMRTGSFDGPNKPDVVTYEGFRSSVNVDAPGGWQYSKAKISIKGMSQDVMNRLSIINYSNTEVRRNEVLVEATGSDGKYNTLFLGTINNAFTNYSGLPDVSFEIEALSSLFEATIANKPTSWPGTQKVSVIVNELCKKMGYTFENHGVESTVTDQVLVGSYLNQARTLCENARCILVNDNHDNRLKIIPEGKPLDIEKVEIRPDNGLIGFPVINHQGVSFQCLYNPEIYHRRPFKLVSSVQYYEKNIPWEGYLYVNGYSLYLDGNTPGGSWHMDVTAYRDQFQVKSR